MIKPINYRYSSRDIVHTAAFRLAALPCMGVALFVIVALLWLASNVIIFISEWVARLGYHSVIIATEIAICAIMLLIARWLQMSLSQQLLVANSQRIEASLRAIRDLDGPDEVLERKLTIVFMYQAIQIKRLISRRRGRLDFLWDEGLFDELTISTTLSVSAAAEYASTAIRHGTNRERMTSQLEMLSRADDTILRLHREYMFHFSPEERSRFRDQFYRQQLHELHELYYAIQSVIRSLERRY